MLERAPESIVWGGPILAPPAQGPCVTELYCGVWGVGSVKCEKSHSPFLQRKIDL
jgi:hypothetical protein